MVLGWPPSKIVSGDPDFQPIYGRQKIEKRGMKFLQLSIAALVQVKMSSKFNCSYMARSSLTYIPGFSVKFFFQPIYTDYAN
jgi:trehalose utilization protein